MGNILEGIVADKRNEVHAAKKRAPLAEVRRRATSADPPRDFYAAVTRRAETGINLIAEIKRRSPSAGLIREDFHPAAIARICHQAGASAISVLTDERYFGGRLEHITQVRDAVPLPVLRKDFVLEAYQVWEARAASADAVLLIAEVLDVPGVLDLSAVCAESGMAVLVEAYNPELLQRVLEAFGKPLPAHVLIGINNRDLTIQKTDVATTRRLARMMDDTSMLVSESGISTRQDVLFVQQAGAAAMLVGEAVMAAEDMGAKIRELLGKQA